MDAADNQLKLKTIYPSYILLFLISYHQSFYDLYNSTTNCYTYIHTYIHREWVATGEGCEVYTWISCIHIETQPRTSVGRYTKANKIAAPYTFPIIVQRNIIHNKYLCIQNNGTQWREKFYLILTFLYLYESCSIVLSSYMCDILYM